jgi:glycosyltransferase involved in cell wall biosynthesis
MSALDMAYVSVRPPDETMLVGLRRARARVSPVTPSEVFRARGKRRRRRDLGLIGRVTFALGTARWLRRHRRNIDVAVALDNRTAALGANIGRMIGGPPVVLQVREPGADRSLAMGAKQAGLAALAEQVIGVIDERLADAIGATSFGVGVRCAGHADRVAVIPWCGVDMKTFAPRWSRAEARDYLELPEGEIVLSRIDARSCDLETLVRAMAELRRRNRPVTLVVIGNRLQDARDVRRAASRVGLEVRTTFGVGADERAMWYVAADVVVQAVKTNMTATTALEALACGVPVVATRIGSLMEALDGGRLGELVPAGDVAALTAAVDDQLSDEHARVRAGKLGRAYVRQLFSAHEVFEDWVGLAREIVEEASQRRVPHNGPRRARLPRGRSLAQYPSPTGQG